MPFLRKNTTNDANLADTAMEKTKRLSRISRLSAVMKWTLTIFMAFFAIIGVVYLAGLLGLDFADILDETVDYVEPERRYGDLEFGQRAALAFIGDALLGAFLIMLWYVRKLFSAFQRHLFFDAETLSDMVKAGIWFLVFGILVVLEVPFTSMIGTYDLPEGQRQVSFEFSGGELLFMFFGILFIVFGWVMREAALIDEENKQFI